MDISIIAVSASLVLFLVAILRFPQTSFQYIMLLFISAAMMYLAVSLTVIPLSVSSVSYSQYTENTISSSNSLTTISAHNATTITSPSPSANQIALSYDISYLYIVLCMSFALMGIVMKLAGQQKTG